MLPPAPASPDSTWGVCSFCAVAVAPGATACGICGAEEVIRASEIRRVSRRQRRRLRATNVFRSFIVIVVVLGLSYTMISLVLQGQPNVPDPLTTSAYYTITPGNYTMISGNITGGDFVLGNFSTSDPVGLNLELSVYNSTQWPQFLAGLSPAPQYSIAPTTDGHLVFSAPTTDLFYFVFTNPYAASTHLTYTAQITTEYASNVADDGFD
ncbi:MAG: hypothetical protein L3J92_05635 [Thermoplasmata archaeon]|nr:hypothetical protein [Thermoplasmata archaeon]